MNKSLTTKVVVPTLDTNLGMQDETLEFEKSEDSEFISVKLGSENVLVEVSDLEKALSKLF